MSQEIDSWFLENLVCPVFKSALVFSNNTLRAEDGYAYPVIQGVPIMLRDNWQETLWVARSSLARAREQLSSGRYSDWNIETLGISDDERESLKQQLISRVDHAIDPAVSYLVAATNGIMYQHLAGRLKAYPIPEIRLPTSKGEILLDVGCNWGRWCIAASRKGYQVVGIDPSLGAVMAARRVAKQLGANARYLVSDARYLPFKESSVDVVFSYSVLQHFSYKDAGVALEQAQRILKRNGYCFVQMPNKFGIRSAYHQFKRGFREPKGFEVRYWGLRQLENTFGSIIGAATLSVDCFFGLGIQPSDAAFMTSFKKIVILLSSALTWLSRLFPPLIFFADSVYVQGGKVAE